MIFEIRFEAILPHQLQKAKIWSLKMDEVATVPPETPRRKSLEDFREELKGLLSSLKPEESDSLEGFSSVCNHGLKTIFGGCPILKVRKLISDSEYMLWFIAKIHEEFVYTLILKVDWRENVKTMKTHKRMEEVSPGLLEDLSYRSFEDLFGFIASGERFDYSIVSNVAVENALPVFDAYLNQISDPVSETSEEISEEVEQSTRRLPKERLEDRRYQEEREYRKHVERRKRRERERRRKFSQQPKKNSLQRKYRVYKPRKETENRENRHRRDHRQSHRKIKRDDREHRQTKQRKPHERKTTYRKRETRRRPSPEIIKEENSSEAVYTSSNESSEGGGLILKNHNTRKGKEPVSETSSEMLES